MTQSIPKNTPSHPVNPPRKANEGPAAIGGNSPGEYISRLKERPDQLYPLLALLAMIVLLIVAYWDSMQIVSRVWRTDPLYSHGYLIPLFALGLLLVRRKPFGPVTMAERWTGAGIILLGLAIRLFAAYRHSTTIDSPTLVICFLGAFLMVGGWSMLRWAGPAVAFLFFMFPLPIFLKDLVMINLQKFATLASTYILQTLNVLAFRSGSRIDIYVVDQSGGVAADPIQLSVIDACSGLRMLTIFIAMAVAIVMVTDRPWWDRLIILLSSFGIAVLVNIIRITITAFMYIWAGDQEWVKYFSHDGAGLIMMPMALGFLYLELQILSHLVVEEEEVRPMNIGGRGTSSPVPV